VHGWYDHSFQKAFTFKQKVANEINTFERIWTFFSMEVVPKHCFFFLEIMENKKTLQNSWFRGVFLFSIISRKKKQ
jgi:hypothetical protein